MPAHFCSICIRDKTFCESFMSCYALTIHKCNNNICKIFKQVNKNLLQFWEKEIFYFPSTVHSGISWTVIISFGTYKVHYTVKKVNGFPVPSRDVTNQTLSGREYLNYSWPGRVWLVTSQLGTRKWLTFFYRVVNCYHRTTGQW